MLHDADKNKKRPGAEPATLSVVKKYDLLVFIGRFQPLHKGHQAVIDKALELSKRVLVIAGSMGKARSTRNPFTFDERKHMINSVYPDVIVRGISDSAYNDTMWVNNVQKIVKEVSLEVANPDGFHNNGIADLNIGLIGHEKDHTSYYLKLFPQWGNEGVAHVNPMNATAIRNQWFEEPDHQRWQWDVILDDNITRYIMSFDREIYQKLREEYYYLKAYMEEWGEGPHLTGDSLVEVGGNILLIIRGQEYGHGLYALPGGFLKKYEKFLDGALRELREETRLKVPAPVLKGSIKGSMVFDDPHRSERGRIVTVCQHIVLENELNLPEVRGSDDAEWAGFRLISDIGTELTEDMFFEDHFHIIRKMLGI
jgi:bifunctional NMN adenylyltransferase/nudix hydrolase